MFNCYISYHMSHVVCNYLSYILFKWKSDNMMFCYVDTNFTHTYFVHKYVLDKNLINICCLFMIFQIINILSIGYSNHDDMTYVHVLFISLNETNLVFTVHSNVSISLKNCMEMVLAYICSLFVHVLFPFCH